MAHPDTARLIEHATQRSAEAAVEGHVRQCAACASEVERWREVAAAYSWQLDARKDAGPDCLDDFTIAALAEGSLQSPEHETAVEHLASCARCRSTLASVAQALSSAPVRTETERLDRPPRRRWLRAAIPVAAAATLVAVFLRDPAVEPDLHRAPATVPGPAPVAIAPDGPTTSVQVLRWHAVAGADRYRVTLFDESGDVLWESALADTVAGLPGDVALEPGRDYFWIVSARMGFDRWETSALAQFSLTGASPR